MTTRRAKGVVLAGLGAVCWLWGVPTARGVPAVGGLLGLHTWREETINLVRNPSFEEGAGEGRVNGWKSSERFSLTSGRSHSGVRSLELRDSHLSAYTPLATQSLALEPGWYSLGGWMKAEGAGTNNAGAGGRISVWWGAGGISTAVVRGTTDWTWVHVPGFPILPGESAWVRLEAYRKPNGRVFFDGIAVRRLVPPTVEGFLRYPNYRGMLFDDGPQTIEVGIRVRPEEAQTRLAGLTIRLGLYPEGRAVPIAAVEESPLEADFVMRLDAGPLPSGVYSLRLEALRRDGRAVVFEYPRHRIVKVGVEERKRLRVWVDQDNVLVLGGRRVFPLGIYDTSGYSTVAGGYAARVARIAEAPVNLYLNYWLGGAPILAVSALLTALQQHGMWYVHTVNAWHENSQHWPGKAECNGVAAAILGPERFTSCMAEALAGRQGLAGWYTADEAPAGEAPRVFHQYRLLQAGAPGGVTFLVQNNMRELSKWRDVADVIGVDPYPLYNVPQGGMGSLGMVGDWVRKAQAAVGGSRPVWAVIQYFQFGSRGRWPTYDELRTMSWMAIVEGANGLFYWSYGAKGLSWVKDAEIRERRWQDLVRVTRELKSLEPVLLAPDVEIIARQWGSAAVRTRGKQGPDGSRYLFTYNSTPVPACATWALIEPVQTARVLGPAAGPGPRVTDGAFGDCFGAYEVKLYQIR